MIGVWLHREPHRVNVRQPRGIRRPSPPRGGTPTPSGGGRSGCWPLLLLFAAIVVLVALGRHR